MWRCRILGAEMIPQRARGRFLSCGAFLYALIVQSNPLPTANPCNVGQEQTVAGSFAPGPNKGLRPV